MPRFTEYDLMSWGYTIDGNRVEDLDKKGFKRIAQSCKREKDLHDQILAYCRTKGLPVIHSRMDVPSTVGVGTPDFVIALPAGGTLWVEAKTGKGKLTKEQSAWMAMLSRLGHQACVVRSMAEFVAQIAMGA